MMCSLFHNRVNKASSTHTSFPGHAAKIDIAITIDTTTRQYRMIETATAIDDGPNNDNGPNNDRNTRKDLSEDVNR